MDWRSEGIDRSRCRVQLGRNPTREIRSVGRGWAALQDDGSLGGRIYFHLGDASSFRAERY